jgi:hypothetical protein
MIAMTRLRPSSIPAQYHFRQMFAKGQFCDNLHSQMWRCDPLYERRRLLVKGNKILALAAAVAIGLEVIAPSGEQHPHTEKEVIQAPEATGTEADALRPFATPPENPWLSEFTLRVTKPAELNGWWVNTMTTRSGGLVTVMRTQTCGEVRFKDIAVLRNLNTNEEVKRTIYLNEDYCISWRNRKMCEQLQEWLLHRGVTAQVLLKMDNADSGAPDHRTLASSYAPIYDDGDGPTS